MTWPGIKTIYIAVAIAGLILLSLLLAYGLNFHDPVSRFFKKFYPQAVVANGLISVEYWDEAQDLAKKLDPSVHPQAVSAQLIKVKEESQLQHSLKISFPAPTLESELKFYTTGKTDEYQNLLKKYFDGSEAKFIEFVVKPQLYDALLRMKYNTDFIANADAYTQSQDILNKVKSGQSFETLARKESDDKVTGQFGGDLGFAAPGQLLPEIEYAVANAQLGQVIPSVVITRQGYEIILPVETAIRDSVKTWHVKHILVKTSGYDNWLNELLKRFWVWRIK